MPARVKASTTTQYLTFIAARLAEVGRLSSSTSLPYFRAAVARTAPYQMEEGPTKEAIWLWRQALPISPALVSILLNLTVALMPKGPPFRAALR